MERVHPDEILDSCVNDGQPKDTYKTIFESIGNHFLDNADRLSEQAVALHAGMKITIEIPINDIVSISINTNEYVIIKGKGDSK